MGCCYACSSPDAWMRIENPVAFFSSFPWDQRWGKSTSLASEQTAAALLFGSGRHWVCRCRSLVREEKKRRRDSAYFETSWQAHVQLAKKRPRCFCCGLLPIFFLGNNHDDTQRLPCPNRPRRASEPSHAQAGGLLAVSDEIDGPPTARLPVPVPAPAVSTGTSPAWLTIISRLRNRGGCFCSRVTAATMMTMGAGCTRSGCFRSADAGPAWIQIDTDRYLPGVSMQVQHLPQEQDCLTARPPTQAPGHAAARTQLAGPSPPSCLVLPCPWPPTLARTQPDSLLNPRCDREGVSLPSGDLSCFCRAAVSEREGVEGREGSEGREGGP